MSFSMTVSGPCNCCNPQVGSCHLECFTRGGVATLCGHAEYVSPSVPPKKYRAITSGGTVSGNLYNGSDCTGFNHEDSCTFTGTLTYDKNTCATSSTGDVQCEVGGVDDPPSPPDFNDLVPTCNYSVTQTPTSQHLVPTGACCGPEGGQYRIASGSQSRTLSIEDTEADAIDRLLAGAGGVWSDFAPSAECLAQYQERTTGFSFSYSEAKYKIKASGLQPFADYDIKVTLFRRVYEIGAYEAFEERTSTINSDEFGFYEGPEETVSNDAGFQTYAGGCTVMNVF